MSAAANAAGSRYVFKVQTCRVCGCTNTRSCAGGCWWVAPDLCSSCAQPADLVARQPVNAPD